MRRLQCAGWLPRCARLNQHTPDVLRHENMFSVCEEEPLAQLGSVGKMFPDERPASCLRVSSHAPPAAMRRSGSASFLP
eukprot:8385841-Pyramimonas_sp.AAC.1